MIDKEFFKIYAKEIVAEYREKIFTGSNAKNVYEKDYPRKYSEPYGTLKRTRKLPRSSARYANKNVPVLTGDLMKDFQGIRMISGGFRFGTPTRGSVVKNLDKLGRSVSSESQPIPKKVESFILDLANKYALKKLGKIKGGTFNIG